MPLSCQVASENNEEALTYEKGLFGSMIICMLLCLFTLNSREWIRVHGSSISEDLITSSVQHVGLFSSSKAFTYATSPYSVDAHHAKFDISVNDECQSFAKSKTIGVVIQSKAICKHFRQAETLQIIAAGLLLFATRFCLFSLHSSPNLQKRNQLVAGMSAVIASAFQLVVCHELEAVYSSRRSEILGAQTLAASLGAGTLHVSMQFGIGYRAAFVSSLVSFAVGAGYIMYPHHGSGQQNQIKESSIYKAAGYPSPDLASRLLSDL
jgi:hypothetical protein